MKTNDYKKEIKKDDFAAYEEVRVSEITNMHDIATVMLFSCLTREKVLLIMNNYRALKNLHG